MPLLQDLLGALPQRGRVQWIGLRESRAAPITTVDAAMAEVGCGLIGDRFTGTPESKRQVTLIQAEHLVVVASLLGRDALDPALVRRNIVVSGVNLLALQRAKFSIGKAVLEGSGGCHPCSRMEAALGAGGFNAMRGHGGITARVLKPGVIRLGDEVVLLEAGELGRMSGDCRRRKRN
jgi:MOSC domain-containing protein YiiM